MKTFEQYIGEARQNYIFGGTDDRNTVIAEKTFAELKPGDDIYSCHIKNGICKIAEVCTFDMIVSNHDGTSDIIYAKRKGGKEFISIKDNYIDFSIVVRVYNYTNEPVANVLSTSEELLLDKIKELTGKKYTKIKYNTLDSIDEARQNYIFGGTDNRNADVKLKVFANVKQGDKIYVWRAREERKVSLERIIDIENRQTKKKIDAENCLCFIDNDELDSDVHCIVDKYSFCIATNFDALQDTVKKVFGKDITEENIREFGVRESKQNYIFGGTDDRNTDVKEGKAFSSLKKGDKLYAWCDNDEDEALEVTFMSSYDDYYGDKERIEIDTLEDEPLYINARDFDFDVSYGESKYAKWCVATTFEALQNTVYGVYKVKIDKKNIATWP